MKKYFLYILFIMLLYPSVNWAQNLPTDHSTLYQQGSVWNTKNRVNTLEFGVDILNILIENGKGMIKATYSIDNNGKINIVFLDTTQYNRNIISSESKRFVDVLQSAVGYQMQNDHHVIIEGNNSMKIDLFKPYD